MKKKYSIKEILNKNIYFLNKEIFVEGWIKSFHHSIFIILNDGSTVKNLQVVLPKNFDKNIVKKITVGSSVKITGIVKKSIGSKQFVELKLSNIFFYTSVPSDILQKSILQPKKHSLEKIRENAHLRFQTKIFSCVMRIRNYISFSVHKFFQKKNFFYLHTPIITTSDCEGSGKMFRITTLNIIKENDYKTLSNDFFKKKTYLSVSGQLEAESAIIGLGKVYTFGPVFRAENSNTTRHLSEFWMIEPEIAFSSLKESIDLAEKLLKFIINYVLKYCIEDLLFLDENTKKCNKGKKKFIVERLKHIYKTPFHKISYTESINILKKEIEKKNIKFSYPIFWGVDLQSEHEQYITNIYFNNTPVIIFDYPSSIKAFYMRVNDYNEKTVSSMDILFPEIGEIVGGSQREERYEFLLKKIKKLNIDENTLWWYLDTRRFGSVPHSGFGLGFDRLVQFITGMNNIRDVIPFPRTPGNAEF
ncbi:asparagine--tRNA ligase [Blattabacterium cuenoti]|uniref:asparagine--tRNA ligase n=1 Tax=Blattabacterium cuenoti TaxID=1653831 RepID=UPI00163B8BA3|nr:asparagine--tRNA ligase [Blattabacterium cuenoti]